MDNKDVLLLEALQEDASRKLEDLARLVHLAPSSVHDRLRRLQKDGVIKRWTVDVECSALGLNVEAFIGIKASLPCTEVVKQLAAIPAIEACHSVAGTLSLLLKVRVAHPSDLMELTETLRGIPGVESTETTIVLKTHLDHAVKSPSSTAPAKPRRR
jgi:Lrp/AsnC family transcriptional regulator, leucine-responsive regulatory protein